MMRSVREGYSLLLTLVTTVGIFSVGFGAGNVAAKTFDGLVVGDAANSTVDGKNVITVEMLTRGKKVVLATQTVAGDKIDAVKASLEKGNLVEYKLSGNAVVVPADPARTFGKVLGNPTYHHIDGSLKRAKFEFDTMKYGKELSPNNGVPGNMVAAGWVYGKTKDTISVGDGRIITEDIAGRPLTKPVKRYEETYKVDKNTVVYNVNTKDWGSSVVSDFASIPVTRDYNHATTARQMVYIVFDKNYTQAARAKVASIYYLTPQSISDGTPSFDVPEMSFLLKDKGVDPVSGKSFVTIRHPYPESDPYTRSTEPFEIIKNAFYYVGDNEVAVYLFHADNGTPNNKADDKLIMLDSGWPMSGYQYWKNIEAMGHDPRKITDIMLTHGHFDHYGSAVELITMIENSGGKVKLWGTKEDTFGITRDALGNSWNIKGALPDVEKVIRTRTVAYEYDKVYNFGNVQILVTPTPGHTPGTGSFVFKIKRPENGEWVSFGYMGGYGFNGMYTPSAGNGYLRLNFQLGLAWLQQMVDVDYVAPQHTNQYPIIEVYQALKAYNNDPANKGKQLTMMDALTRNEFVNFCEKRYSVVTNRLSDEKDKRYKSLETSGPYKPGRENGLIQVRARLLDGGKIIKGFDGFQNRNPNIPLLKDGIQIVTDSYVNDPDGWYVQFYIDVLDDYKGFLPDDYTYAGVYTDKNFNGIFKVGGPVESLRPAQGAPEILRTQRLNSKEEAEKVLKSVRKGGTYYISLTKASAIIVPADVMKTFIP